MGLQAREIMHLAETPIGFPEDNLSSGNAPPMSFVCHVQAAGDKNGLIGSAALDSHTVQTG